MRAFWFVITLCLGVVLLSTSCKKEVAKACFTYSVNGTVVSFNSSCSEHASTYLWEFGINVTSIAPNPTIDYANDGNYKVTLQISGPNGEDTIEQTVVVDNSVEQVCVVCHCWSDFVIWEHSWNFCGTAEDAEAYCNNTCGSSLGSGYSCNCE